MSEDGERQDRFAGGSDAVGANLARVVSLLVDSPREVEITPRRERSGTRFQVRLAEEDLGQLIGRQGRTARALRALLDVRGFRDGRRYGLEIRDS